MPPRLSPEAENRLLRGLDHVLDLVQQGQSPDDALTKVAEEMELPAGHVRLMAQAYNTGRTNQHRRTQSTLLDKLAEFPLAHADDVISRLFPKKGALKSASQQYQESVVSLEYAQPPAWTPRVPVPSDLLPEPLPQEKAPSTTLEKRACAAFDRYQHDLEENSLQRTDLRDKMAAVYDELESYFRSSGPGVDFEDVRLQSAAAYGRPAQVIFDQLHKVLPGGILQKKAGTLAPFDPRRQPYRQVATLVNLLQKHAQLVEEHQRWSNDPGAARLAQRVPRGWVSKHGADDNKKSPPGSGLLSSFKGGFLPSVQTIAAPVMDLRSEGTTFDFKPPTLDKPKFRALEALEDPTHELALTQLHTKAMLNDFLANDPVISGYDPEEVTGAFNEIQRLAPRVASQPSVARALLRRQLAQGQLDTHELDQLAGIEGKLRQNRQPDDYHKLPARLQWLGPTRQPSEPHI